jgi:hypothetical protein
VGDGQIRSIVGGNVGDPPKSPFKRGTLNPVPPFLRGARGDRYIYNLKLIGRPQNPLDDRVVGFIVVGIEDNQQARCDRNFGIDLGAVEGFEMQGCVWLATRLTARREIGKICPCGEVAAGDFWWLSQ